VDTNFEIQKSKLLDDIYIIKNDVFKDKRGTIWSSYIKKDISSLLPENLSFCHDKFSKSSQNVLRGIHGDFKTWKLVTCVYGEIQQVVVNCQKASGSFGVYDSFIINGKNQSSILIPPYYGNAYCVLSKEAVYHYKLAYFGQYLDVNEQFTYMWNSPLFNIKWLVKNPILSNRDKLKKK
jgi:dTDP-4-dehydrorhamnose 3,5-epimerase